MITAMDFDNVRRALQYIDANLDDSLTVEAVAERHHFSPYYFHRMFTAIVGKSLAAHIRARRVEKACLLIAETGEPFTGIAGTCGFGSQQAFNRAFKGATGCTPGEYRRLRIRPNAESVDEMIIRFTNRMKGGMIVKPNIIKKGKLRVAGVTGDGSETAEVWMDFERRAAEFGIPEKLSENGYEIRFAGDGSWPVHVGYLVPEGARVDGAFTVMELPASTYASFDVYVSKGYTSENDAMREWLDTNGEGYVERLLDGGEYVVEYYDERFHGEEEGSIVEIWLPIKKEGET